VGGLSSAVALRWRGDGWQPEALPEGVPALSGVFVRLDGTAVAAGSRGVVLDRSLEGVWTRRPPVEGLQTETLHAVWAQGTQLLVGGDLVRGTHGVLVGLREVPSLGPMVPPVPDASPPDASVPDARAPDASPPDAAPRDAGPADSEPAADVPRPDAQPADAALPGPAEDCPGFRCIFPLECWELASANWRAVCTEPCSDPQDCVGYGDGPCCVAPGPQVVATYCISRVALPGGCGDQE
jgi:hypothetical protein